MRAWKVQPITASVALDEYDHSIYVLLRDFIYVWEDGGNKYRIICKRGMLFDGASVPRLLWTLTGITPDGVHRAAACVHDLLYTRKGEMEPFQQEKWNQDRWEPCLWPDLDPVIWKRHEADKLFCRILREYGVSKLRRRVMYLGVRLGGWLPWLRAKARAKKKALLAADEVAAILAVHGF